MSEVEKTTVIEETRMADELIRHYYRVSKFLEAETIFRVQPLRIMLDGPFAIGGSFEVIAPRREINRESSPL